MMTASMDSPMFSTRTLSPASRARSMTPTVLDAPMRTTWRLFLLSFSLIHATPCSCGSHIRLQRSELDRTVPFWIEVGSDGSPSPVQPATVALSTSTLTGSVRPAVIGVPFSVRNLAHWPTRLLRYSAVNGPA